MTRPRLYLAALPAALAVAAYAAAWLVPLPAKLYAPASRVVLYADHSPAYVFLAADDKWRIPVALDEVDPLYLRALLAREDQRFYSHPGVDPLAVLRAAGQNLAAGRVVSGASTLTMQLARILEPRPRTFGAKLREALRALQLEARLSKREILEAFLRLAPFGKNFEGVEAASLAYFGHRASALDPFEAAYLVAVPQDPNRRYPHPAHQAAAAVAVRAAAERLRTAGVFSAGQYRECLAAPLPTRLRPFPREAPHAAVWLAARAPAGDRVLTHLDPRAQQLAQAALDRYRDELAALGIHNGAAVVIARESGAVAALVGNFDFWDESHQGQVAGFAAPRSPGSALKPFLYALALDHQQLLPTYLVPDIPARFRDYEPRNYDDDFRGLVRIEDALSLSLNVPFVNLLADSGVEPFLSFLGQGGITTLSPEPGHYGLSAIVGGVDVTLLELTNLYAMLGREGNYLDYALFPPPASAPPPAPQRLLSPEAAWLTARALRIKDRPDFPERRRAVELPPDVHWKTGTSYGHRDAWALGSNAEYTVGVWLGNFDAAPAVALVGGERAGPVLFDVLEALGNRRLGGGPPPPPAGLVEVEVCAYSGRLPAPACPRREKSLGDKTRLPPERCPFHVELAVDDATGHQLCPLCRSGRAWHSEVFTLLPPTVRRWISDQRMLPPAPPSHWPGCRDVASSGPPKIVSPRADAVFFLITGLDPRRQEIPLEAEASAVETELAWFVDGRFLAKAPAAERVWLTPEPGEHEIRVVDSAGRVGRVRIRVVPAG